MNYVQMDTLRAAARRIRKRTLALLPLSLLAGGCCCGFSPEDIVMEDGLPGDGVNVSSSGATKTLDKYGITVEVPENAKVETISAAYLSVLIISEISTGDVVSFRVYPPGIPLTPESVEACLEAYKEEELDTWPQATFTDVEMEIFGQTVKGVERNLNEKNWPKEREFALKYPNGTIVAVKINMWPPGNQALVDGIISSAKYDPDAPWWDEETPKEFTGEREAETP